MAVALSLDQSQSNDAKTLLFTDSTGVYDVSTNLGGWGTPNQDTGDIALTSITTTGKYWLTLDIIYTNSSDESTTYDTIDLYDEFTSEFSKEHGMEFELTMAHLLESGVAAGTASDVFPDGIYDITYTITEADTESVVYSKEYEYFVDGIIRKLVYDNMHENISTVYKQKQFNSDERDWNTLLESMFTFSYFMSLLTEEDDATRTQKLEMLNFLEQKLNN